MMETRIKITCDDCGVTEEAVNKEEHVFIKELIDANWMLGNKDLCHNCRSKSDRIEAQKDADEKNKLSRKLAVKNFMLQPRRN